MYHRLYHSLMPGEDNLSSRFDYLFEPLDVEVSVDDTETARGTVNGASDEDETSSSEAPQTVESVPTQQAVPEQQTPQLGGLL